MGKDIEYVDPDSLVVIGLDTDHREGDHPLYDPRVHYDLDEAMIKNIMAYGVQVPVMAREEAGKLLVVDGRQRVRHAREAAKRQGSAGEYAVKIPVNRVRADDARVVGIMVLANEIRRGDEILEKALRAARLYDLCGDYNEVAITFGRTPQTIKNWMNLVEADPAVHAAVREGKITAAAAIEIAHFERDKQKEALDRLLRAASRTAENDAAASAGKVDASAAAAVAAAAPKVSDSAVRRDREEQGLRRPHLGIKKGWLRAALKTQAASELPDEDKAILSWFLTGEAEKGSWIENFVWEVNKEIGGES